MPSKPKRPCMHPGCNELVDNTYCNKHTKPKTDYRKSASERGYNSKWRKARLSYLKSNALCIMCYKSGILNEATVVDHIIPHKGDSKLFWDKTNWQPLCVSCHNSKTAKEDGGFGN